MEESNQPNQLTFVRDSVGFTGYNLVTLSLYST
jgi:hypothetical protein